MRRAILVAIITVVVVVIIIAAIIGGFVVLSTLPGMHAQTCSNALPQADTHTHKHTQERVSVYLWLVCVCCDWLARSAAHSAAKNETKQCLRLSLNTNSRDRYTYFFVPLSVRVDACLCLSLCTIHVSRVRKNKQTQYLRQGQSAKLGGQPPPLRPPLKMAKMKVSTAKLQNN